MIMLVGDPIVNEGEKTNMTSKQDTETQEQPSAWPPSPAVARVGAPIGKVTPTTKLRTTNPAIGFFLGVVTNTFLNIFYMIAVNLSWLAFRKKLMPSLPPAHGYAGTGTPLFFLVVALLSLTGCMSILLFARFHKPVTVLAFCCGCGLTAFVYIVFWLFVENINML